jgi:hypothetical protein
MDQLHCSIDAVTVIGHRTFRTRLTVFIQPRFELMSERCGVRP